MTDVKEDKAPDAPDLTPETLQENSSQADSSEVDEMAGVINEFLVESYENLDQLDRDLVDLEQNPTEKELLSSIFRIIHTIKGTCGFLGFSKLESLTHVGENLLSRLRDGELVLNPDIANALLSMVDAVRQIFSCIESSRNEGDVDYSELAELLSRLTKGESGSAAAVSASPPAADAAVEPASPNVEEAVVGQETPVEIEKSDAAELRPEKSEVEKGSVENQPGQRKSAGKLSETSIRVDVDLLDKLMNLVGELVLARNQIVQFSNKNQDNDSGFIATSQHLNLLTTELQEGVMKTRMQPIGNIWSKFPRVVRDLARSCNKQVRIEMEGKETELDKTIIEAIKDPLTHIVRNSVDHGIEMPEDRVAKGKPAEGCLFLRAFHEGGQVIIEVKDDGGGIDPERIKRKALEKNVITSDQASRMNERELVQLIFAPGFSTAAKVTNVSGRGVGMDVVKTNIEKIGGSVDIQSKLGEGTSLKVKIPLTLAIIPALIVTCGKGRYAIPQVSLLEMVRLDEKDGRGVEMIHGAPVYRLRGNLLPLVNLNQALGLKPANGSVNGAKFVVVLQANDRHFGLVVEGIANTEEIVVKPLGKQLKRIKAIAGATIMGDGKVALILDILGLAQDANVVSEARDRALKESATVAAKGEVESQNLLVFSVGDKGRMAILLDMVGRLEEFQRSKIETSGDRDVVQYRGEIMSLIYLSRFFNTDALKAPEDHPLQAVVYSEKGKSVGLVVDRIIDIVEETVNIERKPGQLGVLGTAVIKERVTDLVDIRAIIRSVMPEYYEESEFVEPVAALAERT